LILDPHPLVLIAIKNPSLACDVGGPDIRRARGGLPEFDLKLDNYNMAIALNPNDGEAYRKRGIVYEAKGDRVRATADYDQADMLELQAMTKPSQAK
jgi:tetratricopeptide (TPR) repeat protein